MRAAVYARFSSDLQSDRSIEDQIELCRDHAGRRGLSIVETYSDRAVSGASVHGRPAYEQMLGAALAGRFDLILAEDLDRLSRNQADIAKLYERMSFLGVRLVTVADGDINEMHIGLKGTMSAMFLKNLALKVRRGLMGVVRDGRHAGGRAYGYRPAAGKPGELEIIEEEAVTIRRIFAEFVAGRTPRAIAADLNREDVQPPRGQWWIAATINGNSKRGYGLLQNSIYAGQITWGRVRMSKNPDTGKRVSRVVDRSEWMTSEAPHLRIVEDETWRAAQRIKGARSHIVENFTRKPRHLLSGLLRCGSCGAGMSVKDREGQRIRIMCTQAKESRTCANRRPFYLDAIEAATVAGLRERLTDTDAIAVFVRKYNAKRKALTASSGDRRAKATARLAAAERDLNRILDLTIKGVVSEHEAREKLPALRVEVAAARAEQDSIEDHSNTIALHPQIVAGYLDKIERLAAALRTGEVGEDVKSAVRDLVETVTIFAPDATGSTEIEVRGYLGTLIGEDIPPNMKVRGGWMVAGGRLSRSPLKNGPRFSFRAPTSSPASARRKNGSAP